jgi:hypothetical protein
MANKEELTGFSVVKLHYSADPEKDEAWAAKAKKEYPTEDWEREFELKPVGHVGNYPVFNDYKRVLHESDKLIYVPTLKTVIRGWDFGKVHPCVEYLQVDGLNKNFIGEQYGDNVLLDPFVQLVLEYSASNFKGAEFIDWVDATGKNERDDGRSSVKVLMSYGIKPKWRMQEIEEGVKYMREEMVKLNNGRPQFMLNQVKCPHLAAACRGGYQRKKNGEIIKDGTHDHPVDAARYGIMGVKALGNNEYARFTEKIKGYKYKPQNQWTGR